LTERREEQERRGRSESERQRGDRLNKKINKREAAKSTHSFCGFGS